MIEPLIGKTIDFLNSTGTVELVYTEAVASGTRDYTPYTMLLVKLEDGTTKPVYPRDVTKIHKRPYTG
jgi:hypothetical protein